MRNFKLIRILKKLTVEELDEFRDFVYSPFFNKNKKCMALCDLLLPYGPNFSAEEMNNPEFTKKIYTNERSLETVMERTLRLLERFLAQKGYEEQEELSKYFLLEGLRKRDEVQHYDLVYRRTKKKNHEKPMDNAVLYGRYLLEVSHLEMLYKKKASQEAKIKQLEKTIHDFNKYVLSNHIRLDNIALNAQGLGSPYVKEVSKKIIDDSKIFMDMASKKIYSEEPLINLRVLFHQLLEHGNDENFDKLFNKLKEVYLFIGDVENKHFNKFLANYFVEKAYLGNVRYYKKLLDVYMFAMEIGTLIEEKYLNPSRLKNIIIACVKSNQIDLADILVDKYIHRINPKYRDVMEAYSQGYLHFQKKEYEKAVDFLRKCTNMKSLFELDAQSILYKIYYETNEEWAFDVPVQSFIKKLSRHKNKHPPYTIKGFINFFRILKQLYRKKENPNYKKTTADILENINKMKYLSDKQWLKEKLDELDSRK